MSNYVNIASSPGEIIRIAVSLSARGRELTAAVTGINGDIVAAENPQAFAPDQFTASFKPVIYEHPVEAEDSSIPANAAVMQSAASCGEVLTQIGDFVNQAMTNYSATDDDSGDDIAATV